MESQFVSCTNAVVPPQTTQMCGAFLTAGDREYTQVWVLAQADRAGGLTVQLVDQNNRPLSDVSEIFGAGNVSRSKMLNVRIPTAQLPPVVRIQARNMSDSGNALVEGVLLVM